MFKANWESTFNPNPLQKQFIESRAVADLFSSRMGEGKALSVDCPIPTPSGWATMGELAPGDFVFDERGQPCRVMAVSDVMAGRPCFRVKFSDGAEIIADAKHLWLTTTHNRPERDTTKTRTTEEIAATLVAHSLSNKWNHRVAIAEALDLPERTLPIDPYVLGVWLGDGNSCGGRITIADTDTEIINHMRAAGEIVGPKGGTGSNGYYRVIGLTTRLRQASLQHNKHIPAAYMRASKAQRIELLQGLLDTDGTISHRGQVGLTLMRRKLAEGALELVRSLGFRGAMTVNPAVLNGRVVGTRFRIRFQAPKGTPVFKLARKRVRQPELPPTRPLSMSRMIVGCEAVPSVLVKCIAVDSPSRLFLASKHLVPTHNSAALAWAPYYHTVHNPGARWLILRDTHENLERTTMKEFFKWFPPGIMGTYHHTRKCFTWADGVASGEVLFMGLDDPADATKLQSMELAGVCMDEPAPAQGSGGIDELVFDISLSRLRQPAMHWYGMKLAENNPDETHWSYRRFVQPGTDGFAVWQPVVPENAHNLPADYYEGLRRLWAHRPDLQRRFIDGKFGFQSIGKAVTPEWADDVHLALGLTPVRGVPITLLWDFGLNPTCIITQVTPQRSWLVLDAMVGDGIGVEELCDEWVIPLLTTRYRQHTWSHIGDPQGAAREQSASRQTAVRMLIKKLGGQWRAGPKNIDGRVQPLKAALVKQNGGVGMVRVDRHRAAPVWHALRGGWHYNVTRAGVTSHEPVKDMHSHPGDAMGYGAAVLFPMGKMQQGTGRPVNIPAAAGFGWQGKPPASTRTRDPLLRGRPTDKLPKTLEQARARGQGASYIWARDTSSTDKRGNQ